LEERVDGDEDGAVVGVAAGLGGLLVVGSGLVGRRVERGRGTNEIVPD
jgi:hypothetical protein